MMNRAVGMHRAVGPRLALLTAVLAIGGVGCSSPPANVTVNEPARPEEHRWDEHENQAWHRFLSEKKRDDHEYAKSDRNEQSEYWGWRHSHPD
jgi:hypothetical protein